MADKPDKVFNEKDMTEEEFVKDFMRPCQEAGKLSESAAKSWMAITAQAVYNVHKSHWRWRLTRLRQHCHDHRIECPYSIAYMVQLAETQEAVEGDPNRGVPTSVLITGRHHPRLLTVIREDPNITVLRMKAYMTKEVNNDPRSVDEIEAAERAERQDESERNKRKGDTEKIMEWDSDKVDDLMPEIREKLAAYKVAITRLRATEDADFDAGDLAAATQAAKDLAKTLERISSGAKVKTKKKAFAKDAS